jgi:hypothetical protein
MSGQPVVAAIATGRGSERCTVLFGLVALGHIALRKIDGHDQLRAFLAKEWAQAA